MGIFDFLMRKKKKKKKEVREYLKSKLDKNKNLESEEQEKLDNDAIREWRSTIEKLSKHPLTQAKVINEELLFSLLRVLEEIKGELNEIKLEVKKGKEEELKKLASKIDELRSLITAKTPIEVSDKDRDLLLFISSKREVTAEDVANKFSISRSNASMRLNRLVKKGYLEKFFKGRKAWFRIKEKRY